MILLETASGFTYINADHYAEVGTDTVFFRPAKTDQGQSPVVECVAREVFTLPTASIVSINGVVPT